MSLRSALNSLFSFRPGSAKPGTTTERTQQMVSLFLSDVGKRNSTHLSEAQRAESVRLVREALSRRRGQVAKAVYQDLRYSEGQLADLQILLQGRQGSTFQELLGFYNEVYPWIGENVQEVYETVRCMFTTITLSGSLVFVECVFRCGDLEQVFPTVTIWVGEEADVRVWIHEEPHH